MFTNPMPTSKAHPSHNGCPSCPVAVSMVILVAQMKAKSNATTNNPRIMFTTDFILMSRLVCQNQTNRCFI